MHNQMRFARIDIHSRWRSENRGKDGDANDLIEPPNTDTGDVAT